MRRIVCALLISISLLTVAGCCCPAINSAREAARDAQSRNNIKMIALAAINFQTIHETWPESLADLREVEPDLDTVLVNPLTLDNPGYEYVKPPEGEDVVLSETAIIYQLRDGARDMSLPVGYADGSVR